MFRITENMFVRRAASGRLQSIEHIREPFTVRRPTPIAASALADEYVREVASTYSFESGLTDALGTPIPGVVAQEGSRLHRTRQREVAGSVVVEYAQSYAGLPVWRAGFSVHIAQDPLRVTSSDSAVHESVQLGNDPAAVARAQQTYTSLATLNQALHLDPARGATRVNRIGTLIYQYQPDERVELPEPGASFEQGPPLPALPPVPPSFVAGKHYAVTEVLFDYSPSGFHDLHWRALIEPLTGVVLYLRAFIAYATGQVFLADPITQSGDATLTPAAAEASLAPYRASETLSDLVGASPQPLHGTQVRLANIESPNDAGPTTTAPFAFNYAVKSTEFSATNAYRHVNWCFNLVKGMGFSLASYFDGTTFPVQVDHWSLGGSGTVNAHCPGDAEGNGIGHFCFASAQSGQTVGIADDLRVVLHEFGHALLWDHVASPNFGFAHSAGDSLAAILLDPTSQAPDRFLTFPWPQGSTGPLDRRHDRAVSAGWGWFGSRYNTQYNGEQVLSTTLFRLYRSLGGDSPHLGDRQWAARYVSYLIIKAIGLLTTTTNNPEVFVTALMNADLTTASFEGQPGGAVHKVIRWAFEKQGLYGTNAHPGAGTPVTTEGNPPAVDVYINDGRNGEYPYLHAFWESPDMWCRRAPDGGTTHQSPLVGATNYMYVRVKNRGTSVANNVSVKAYHCDPGAGLAWPTHWKPMDTPVLAGAAIASGGSTVVGPFAWVPETVGHECLIAIASATGDPGNDTTVASPIPHSRFVPFDNNVGQRNVRPVAFATLPRLPEVLKKLRFRVVNPFATRARVTFEVVLPRALRTTGYWGFFSNEGAHSFELAPHESREVVLSVVNTPRIPPRRPWIDRTVITRADIPTLEDLLEDRDVNTLDDIVRLARPVKIRVVALIDGQNMGGMTYELQQARVVGPVVRPGLGPIIDAVRTVPGVTDARIRRVTFDVDINDDGIPDDNG